MVREAPELMEELSALRAQFPGSKITHFKAGNLELGESPREGWTVDEQVRLRVASQHAKDNPPPVRMTPAARRLPKKPKA